MDKNQTQSPSNSNRKNQKKEQLEDKLRAKLKKKLQQVKENGSAGQTNIRPDAPKPALNSTAESKPKPKVIKPENDKPTTSYNKNNKQNGEKKPSNSQKLAKKRAKLAKKPKQPANATINEPTKNNKGKKVSTKETKSALAINKPKGKKKKKNQTDQKSYPSEASKRPIDVESNAVSAKRCKRMKTVNGFVEIDANDEEGIQLVEQKLKKRNSKLGQSKTMQIDVGPPVIVHEVPERAVDSGTNSDSEDDSYIDKFFNRSDEEFDENHVYSQDEIESKKVNGFLSMDSEDGSSTDQNASSDDPKLVNRKTMKYNRAAKNHELQSDDSSEDSVDVDYYETETDDSNNHYDEHELLCTDDSDISLGSEVQSDENELNYGSSFESGSDEDDINSQERSDVDCSDMEEEESDDYSYSAGSDCSDENNQSDESSDTYEDFMRGKDHDSDDDHEYTDEAYDDVRIPQGTAIIHQVDDLRIKVFKNDNKSRIIEIPKSDTEDDECPALVPIGMKKNELARIQKSKIKAEKIKIKAINLQIERQKLEYEERIQDYYNMDDKQKQAKIDTDARNRSEFHLDESYEICEPVIIKVPEKTAKTLSIFPDWEKSDDIVMNDNCSMLSFPEVEPGQCVIRTVTDGSDVDDMLEDKPISNSPIDTETDQVDEMEVQSGLDSSFSPNSNQMENESSEEVFSPNVPLSKAAQIIKGKPKFCNSLNSRHVLLLLRNIIYFHGSLNVKLIAGNATVFGYELQQNTAVTVHSPRGHSLIYLIPNPNKKAKHDLSCLNSLNNDFFQRDLALLREEFDDSTDAIIMLERDRNNKGVNMIERYMRETMFPNVNAFNNESPHYSSEFVLHCKFSYRPKNGLILNDEWSTVHLNSESKLVTIGGKSVGKSTFLRYTINSNFTKFQKFLFIDLDIGQPELFVPQTLSVTVLSEPVLGPGYLRNIRPVKAVLFGDVNVLPDPIKYLRCVIEIAKFCTSNAEYRNIPWIINTMGYSRGFGNELMACILKIFQPTDLVQIQSQSHLDNFDRIIDAKSVNTFKFNVCNEEMQNIEQNCNFATHVFNAIYNDDHGKRKQIDLTAKDFRYTNILANLGNCLKCNSEWLTSVKPFEASLNDLKIIISSGEEVDESQYLDILNGNLVYLCQKRDEDTVLIADCYGIGIVRSVDVATNKIYLLSTIPLNGLCNVNALAIGAIPLPSAVFLNQHSQIHGTVPYVYNTVNFVGSKQVAQHIFRSETNRKNKPIELMDD